MLVLVGLCFFFFECFRLSLGEGLPVESWEGV
jgi:hypothetical protein